MTITFLEILLAWFRLLWWLILRFTSLWGFFLLPSTAFKWFISLRFDSLLSGVFLVNSKQLFSNRFYCRSKCFSIINCFCCNSVLIKEFYSCKNEILDFNNIFELCSAINLSLQWTCCFRIFISFLSSSISFMKYALISTNCMWLFWDKSEHSR